MTEEDADIDAIEDTPRSFARFDPTTGEVISAGKQLESVTLIQIALGQPVVFAGLDEVAHGDIIASYYVTLPDRILTPREPFPGYLDGLWLRNVPVGSVIRIGSRRYDVTESDVELVFDYPDLYRLEITHPRYLAAEIEVNHETAP